MEQNRRVRVSFERLIDTSSPDRGTFDSEEEEEFFGSSWLEKSQEQA